MAPLDLAIVWLGSLLLAGTLIGLFVRRRHAVCWSFTAYVAAVLIPQILEVAWPSHFYTKELWLLKEVVHAFLKFAIILELSVRILQRFPGAFAAGERVGLAVVMIVYLVVVSVPAGDAGYQEIAGRLLPRVLNGTIWLFVALSAVVLWYRLPIQPLHKAILVGFVPYLLAFSVVMTSLDSFGWDLRGRIGYLSSVAYLALEAYWLVAVWRRDDTRVIRSA
jgi:hypothetical protein